MSVTRCVCRNVPFAVIARAAAELRARGVAVTLDTLIDLTTAGTGCGTCRPYMARAAITGQDSLPVMHAVEAAWWLACLPPATRPTTRTPSAAPPPPTTFGGFPK